jgi:hypothetical protein
MKNTMYRKLTVIVLAILAGALLASLALAAAPPPPPPGWTPPEVRCPFGKAPTLDGVAAQGEWDDALVVRQAADPWPHDTMAQQLNVTYDPKDLACSVRMKHDGKRLYVLCEVADDLLYNLDTEEWAPPPEPPKKGRKPKPPRQKPYWKSPPGEEDWGWWGDCFEIGICANLNGDYAGFPVTGPSDPNKPGECWKVQGNVSYGRVMGGEALRPWTDKGAMQCAMKRRGNGYVQEWAIAFDPCLAVGDGRPYQPGQSPAMGLQFLIIDADTPGAAAGSLNKLIHHQGVWPYCGKGPKKGRVNWARLRLLPQGMAVSAQTSAKAPEGGASDPAATQPAWKTEPRRILPDRSQGLAGLVGPFLWGRAADLGAEVRFSDESGAPKADGNYLWLYQFKRGGRTNPETLQLHERNNLTSRHPSIAYEFQPCRVVTNTTQGYQVMKLMVGYVGQDHVFQHGDNTDLVHLADTPRVCVFVPIRRKSDERSFDQDQYVIDEKHDQAPFGVFELAAGETMASGPNYREVAQRRVLLDLRPTLAKLGPISPGIQKPRFRFTIEGGGKWTLKIEPDGREGLKGGSDKDGWDLTFTESSPGARPYTVDLDPAGSTWALSVFNPGGMEESSEIVVGLAPFDRASGRPVPWPSREERVRTAKVDQLEKAATRPYERRRS